MDKNHYLFTDEEFEVLSQYEEFLPKRTAEDYDKLPHNALVLLCMMKDKNNALFQARFHAAQDVICGAAAYLGINSDNLGLALYYPLCDGSSVLLQQLKDFMDKAGDKGILKKRVKELEHENAFLRSLIQR